MSWSERHLFFERILAMRDRYARSSEDRTGVLSVSDAILYAEAVMAAVERDREPWLAELDQAYADGYPRGRHMARARVTAGARSSRSGPASRRRLLGDADRA